MTASRRRGGAHIHLRSDKGDGEVSEPALENLGGHSGGVCDTPDTVDSRRGPVGEREGDGRANLEHGGSGQQSSEEVSHFFFRI